MVGSMGLFGFEGVETFAEDPHNAGLRNKCFGVDFFNDAIDTGCFAAAADDHYDFLGSFGVSSGGIEDSDTPMDVMNDSVGYFFVFGGENHDLRRRLAAGEEHVDGCSHGEHDDIAVYDTGQVFEDKVRAPDDDDIDKHDKFAEADVSVLVDNHGDDIGTAG